MRSFVVAMVLVGCGSDSNPGPDPDPDPPPADTAQSGTRLKLSWFDFDDGFRTVAMMETNPHVPEVFDVSLDVGCEPREWTDDVMRCTPELGQVLYEDGACTLPVLQSGNTPFHAEGNAPLRPTSPVYVRSTASKQLDRVFERHDNMCVPVPVPGGTKVLVFDVASTEQPSIFAAMSSVDVGDGRVVVETLQSEDGLLVPLRLRDTELDVTCSVDELARATAGSCIAEGLLGTNTFADDACLDPVVVAAERPKLAALNTFSCPRYFEVGAVVPNGSLYETSIDQCRMQEMQSNVTVYRLGARVEAATFTRTVEPTATRAQPIYIENGTTRFRHPGRLFDRALGSECRMTRATSQTWTCQPDTVLYEFGMYTDAACTQPGPNLLAVEIYTGCAVAAPRTLIDLGENGFAGVGPRYTAPIYEFSAGCYPIHRPLYEIGAPIDVPRLMATKRRDP